jgi:hypothetical protein
MLAGGTFAAFGAGLRASGTGNGAFLFDVLGWFIACAGAVVEARSAGFWFEVKPAPVRRRAILLLVLGLAGGLAGCITASTVAADAGPMPEAAAMLVLVAGAGAVLAGGFSLAWTIGGDYAGRRIEQLSDEEW